MSMIVFLLIITIVLYLLFRPRQSAASATQHCEEGHSYLYYLDKKGKLQYEEETCRGCMELTAQELREKGYTITELHLGNKWSGDL